MEARKEPPPQDMKRCMTCYAEEVSELTPVQRLEVVLGERELSRPQVPWEGDCEYEHFAQMRRYSMAKAARILAGTQKPSRKKKTDHKQDDDQPVHKPQGSLF